MEVFFESADVAKRAGISAGLARREAAQGRLEVAATTPRGVRLFRPAAVERYAEQRRQRRAAREMC